MPSAKQLRDDISKGKFKHVYYFYGSEDYRRTEAEKFVADHFLPQQQRSLNYHRIDSKRTPAPELAAALSNLPMLGEKQVYIVGSFESYKQKDLDRLLPYIKPNDSNRIIILSTPAAKTPKKTSTFFKAISEFAETVEFRKLTVEETQAVISSRLAKNNLSIESQALDLLTALVDGDKGGLESELSKLIDFKSEGGEIGLEDVRKVSAGHEIFDIFALGDIIVQGKSKEILRMLNSLLGAGTSIDMLIALLQQHFISIYLVKNGKPPVGNRGFLIPKFRIQAKGYSNSQIEQIIIALAEANSDLRHQRLPEELILETLTFSLANLK